MTNLKFLIGCDSRIIPRCADCCADDIYSLYKTKVLFAFCLLSPLVMVLRLFILKAGLVLKLK